MARYPELKAICRINGEIVCEIDKDKNVKWVMPQAEFEKNKQKMMDNVGKRMSRYLQGHPEATMWNT